MKARIIFFFLFLAFLVPGLVASEKGPIAVSPGTDAGIAVVEESCPTFSWTAMEWAKGYKIEVFEAFAPKVLSYEDMQERAVPILSKEIQGRALSWTPTSDKKLYNGSTYIWYVQALDAYGTAKWSEGRMFRVELNDRLVGLIDKVTETLKANGVSEDVISKVVAEMIPEKEGGNISTEDSKTKGYTTEDRIGIQGHEEGTNTWYGEFAGASLTSGFYNTFMGQYAGNSTATGFYNTFIGQNAGVANISGGHNTFMGHQAGYSNTSGYYNTFIGQFAGYSNTTANGNTFMGQGSGYYNTTGYDNTFIGRFTGNANTGGYENTFIGTDAGISNTGGLLNTFVGADAGYGNSAGDYNTFIGADAGVVNTTGNYNTFLGQFAGYSNSIAEHNTFLGQSAGLNHSTGDSNTFIGQSAGSFNTSGSENTFVGRMAGWNNGSGLGNVFLGYRAGGNESGSNKLYVDNSDTSSPLIYGDFSSDIVAVNGKLGVGTKSPGYDLEVETTGKNAVFLLDRTDGAKAGYAAYGNMALLGTVTDHPLMLGVNYAWRLRLNTDNSLVMANGAQCTAGGVWQDSSSRAYKENIRNLTAFEANETLLNLNPVRYNYKKDKEDEHLGFIAEDVPDLVASKDRRGMSPMDVVAVLTKVVQGQQETIADLQKRIVSLERKSSAPGDEPR